MPCFHYMYVDVHACFTLVVDSDDSPTPQSDNYNVGVYIARYTYTPSEMSPNQNFDLELPLTAGDYLYVYGDMDEDGYYHGQLMTGQSGMIPSNFIEKVEDEGVFRLLPVSDPAVYGLM